MVNGVGKSGAGREPLQPDKSIFRSGSSVGAKAADLVRGLTSDLFQASDKNPVAERNRDYGVAMAKANFGQKDTKVDMSSSFAEKLSSFIGQGTRTGRKYDLSA